MAEQYIADVVRRGAKAIQHWREAHPKAPVMLVGLDLSGLNLVGANLSGANMSGCNLHLCTMISVDLSEAKLTGAKMRGANLVGANLTSADLQQAVLTGAILQNANLEGANLGGANLRRADLRGALLRGANFEGADMQDALITEAEYAQIRGGGSAAPEERGVEESDVVARFTVELGVVITAVELARLLKAFDDIHLLLNIGPVAVDQAAINLNVGGPDHLAADRPRNCLVVCLDARASAWLGECLGTRFEHLKSAEARILRYKKLGLSEQEVWHNIRPALEEGTDPLAVLRELHEKHVVLSYAVGTLGGGEPPAQMQAALDQVLQPTEDAAPDRTEQVLPRGDAKPPWPRSGPLAAGREPKPAADVAPPRPAATAPPSSSAGDADIQAHIEQLDSQDWSARAAAADALGNLGAAAQSAMPFLMKTVEDENIFVREAAEDAIRKITNG